MPLQNRARNYYWDILEFGGWNLFDQHFRWCSGSIQVMYFGVNFWSRLDFLWEYFRNLSTRLLDLSLDLGTTTQFWSFSVIKYSQYISKIYNSDNSYITSRMSYQCAVHPDTPITHFCQSCLDLVCQKCTSKQPHSGSMHKIKQLKDSANIRKNMYAEYVNSQVNMVRSECQKKICCLGNFRKDVDRDRKVIEKDIKIQFQAIGNRLEDKQLQAIIGKQTEIKHLQNYVHSFDDISATFDSVYENPQGMLISYKILDTQIRKLQSLKHNLLQNLSPQPNPTTLPRQFCSTIQKSQTLPHYQARNDFLNKIIHSYAKSFQDKLQQTKQNCAKLGQTYEHTYNDIFSKVVDDQVAKVCAFCGAPYTIAAVNEQCANNRSFKVNCIYADMDWEAIIPQDVRGSRRHFWIKSGSAHRKRPKLQQHSLVRKVGKKHYWNALYELEMVKHILKKHEINTGKTFKTIVQGNDPNNTGYISKIAFIYTLTKIYQISKEQVESLISLLQQEKGINYGRLDQILENPTKDYFKFVQEEEEMVKSKPVAPPSVYSKFRY